MSDFLSTSDVARLFQPLEEWRVRRLFEAGDLPEPPRMGGRRIIERSQLPLIIEALSRRNWWREQRSSLPDTEAEVPSRG